MANLPAGGKGAVEIWFNTTNSAVQTLYDAETGRIGGDGLLGYLWTDVKVNSYVAGSSHTHSYATQWEDGRWHQLIYVWDDQGDGNDTNDTGTLYFDGSRVQSDANVNNAPTTFADIYVGQRPSTDSWRFYGALDEFTIYDEVLSDDDVLTLYHKIFPVGTVIIVK